MTLTLEIITAPAAMPSVRQQTFRERGGSVGRHNGCDWVLPDSKVSGKHAVITYRNGVFYIEDQSRNGVFINSTSQRLTPRVPTALQSGDCLFIEPYEIQVSISEDADERALGIEITDDPFGQRLSSPVSPIGVDAPDGFASVQESAYEVDPMKILGGTGSGINPPGRRSPARADAGVAPRSLDELERRGDPLLGNYQSPSPVYEPPQPVTPLAPAPPAPVVSIPLDYDPMQPLSRIEPIPKPPEPRRPVVPVSPPVTQPLDLPMPAEIPIPPPVPPAPAAAPAPVVDQRAGGPVIGTAGGAPVVEPPPPARDTARWSDSDLALLLREAGLDKVQPTTELAESLGRLLKVVASGVLDLLAARQQIKSEFRINQTQFRPTGNNPLKFSANPDHALKNLFVDPNPAYLQPVEAFGDAFDDLRNHELAMLAGLRVAFEAMLSEFDPERLVQQFDRQAKKGALISVPAKMRYWDAYREKSEQLLKDVDATFRRWFGEEFVKAYEEQIARLASERRRKPR